MEQSDFHYGRKPAFISFLLIYIFCFGISYLLIKNSPLISRQIAEAALKLGIPHSNRFQDIPFGAIVAFVLVIYGFHKLLWNMMTSYEITPAQIRLLAGSLNRREQIYNISDLHEITFKQSLLETPFGIGSLIVRKGNAELIIKGIFNVEYVADSIRGTQDDRYHLIKK